MFYHDLALLLVWSTCSALQAKAPLPRALVFFLLNQLHLVSTRADTSLALNKPLESGASLQRLLV